MISAGKWQAVASFFGHRAAERDQNRPLLAESDGQSVSVDWRHRDDIEPAVRFLLEVLGISPDEAPMTIRLVNRDAPAERALVVEGDSVEEFASRLADELRIELLDRLQLEIPQSGIERASHVDGTRNRGSLVVDAPSVTTDQLRQAASRVERSTGRKIQWT